MDEKHDIYKIIAEIINAIDEVNKDMPGIIVSYPKYISIEHKGISLDIPVVRNPKGQNNG